MSGPIFRRQRGAQRFEQPPLFARQFRGNLDVNIHVQVALAAAVRIGHAFTF